MATFLEITVFVPYLTDPGNVGLKKTQLNVDEIKSKESTEIMGDPERPDFLTNSRGDSRIKSVINMKDGTVYESPSSLDDIRKAPSNCSNVSTIPGGFITTVPYPSVTIEDRQKTPRFFGFYVSPQPQHRP
jgi:hypothetical protein